MAEPINWGVLGTANIAARSFLPALTSVGGRACIVGSRSAARAASWAADNGVGRTGSYADVLAADDVAAVYVGLPNDLHVQWAGQAVAAGHSVLCEKPLGLDAGEVAALLERCGPAANLWEAFVFPFHPQTILIQQLLAEGRLGALREIQSEFHFSVGNADNIRLQAARGGGALYDVGCYPIRLARLLTGTEPTSAVATAGYSNGVDLTMAAVLDFPDETRLIMSAGMSRSMSTWTRIIGDTAELRVSNPFHPAPSDTLQLWSRGALVQEWSPQAGTAFSYAIDHIQRVIAGTEAARYRAGEDALAQAQAMDLVRSAMPGSAG